MKSKPYEFIEHPEHIFQCVTPPAPAHVNNRYDHPVYPLWCNELGMIFFDDDVWEYNEAREGNLYITCGNKKSDEEIFAAFGLKPTRNATIKLAQRSEILWSCYNGRKPKGRVSRLNHNPYDNRKENLFTGEQVPIDYSARKDWWKSRDEFEKRSVQEINKRVCAVIAKGGDPVKYMEWLRLPTNITRIWKINRIRLGLDPAILDNWGNL